MAYELIYTSAAKGLRLGTRGFCTVAHTRGMPPQSIQLLEAMSAYKNLYGVLDRRDREEPVAWSHVISGLAGAGCSVLSRISSTLADHTGRSNKLAHHVMLSSRERCAGGPAWLSMQPAFFRDTWNEEPHLLENQREIPPGDYISRKAENWKSIFGDAGHAAFLADNFLAHPENIAVIVFKPGMDMLPLIAEAIALLEPSQRWRVTYNTYFSSLPAGATCAWRCCVLDSEALREARRNPRATILDLTSLPLPPVTESPTVEIARNGAPVREAPQEQPKPEEKSRKFVLMSNRNINMLTLRPKQ